VAVAGIAAEYNVFHRGHAGLLALVRERLGADTPVVACMSGNFVQRGDFAIMEKHARAEAALRGGVDLVLELPTPWAAACAERFAQGCAAVLAATGVVTHMAFGCECGALAPLQRAAACLQDPGYGAALRNFWGEGMPFAAARQAAVAALAGADAAACLARPNDSLAVEYLRALAGSPLQPLALPRAGAAHDSGALEAYASASAIRRLLLAGGNWRAYVPAATAAVLDRELAQGRAPVSMATCERAVLARLRTMRETDFLPYDGGNEGLYHRFYSAVRTAPTVEALLAGAKTRRYPLARLRRMLLQSYLGCPQAAQGETPACLRVLGMTDRGRALLRRMSVTAALPVLTKPAQAKKWPEGPARTQFFREAGYTDLYGLAYPALAQALPGEEFRRGPVLV